MSSVFPKLLSLTSNARALVVGGTGKCGSGIVLAMLKQGAKVIVVNRHEEHYDELYRDTPEQFQANLANVVGDVMTEEGVKEVFERSMCHGPIQHVVTSIKGKQLWWPCGHMVDQTLGLFYNVMGEEITGHFLLMKKFLPYLAENVGTSYTVVSGSPGSCNKARATPSSRLALSNSILAGLVDGARADFGDSRVAVSEFRIQCLVHDEDDLEICGRGAEHVGKDLIGQAVTACVAGLTRDRIIINHRGDAQNLAKTKTHSCKAKEIFCSVPAQDQISPGT